MLLCRVPVGASRPWKHPSILFLGSPEHTTKGRRVSHLLFPFRHPEGCSLLLSRAAQTLPRERPAPLRIRPLTHARLRHPARMILVPTGSGCFLRGTYVHCKPPEHVGCPVALCRFASCPAAEDSLSQGGSTPLAFQQLPMLHRLLRLQCVGSRRSQVTEWALLGSTGSTHPAFNTCKSVVLSQGKRDPMQLFGRMSRANPDPKFPT